MIFQEAEVKAKIDKYNAETAGMLAAFPKDLIVEVSGEDAEGKERSTADMVAEIKTSMGLWFGVATGAGDTDIDDLRICRASRDLRHKIGEIIYIKLYDIRLIQSSY